MTQQRNHNLTGATAEGDDEGVERRIAEVATGQGGPISLSQLREAGIDRSGASRRNGRGSLHRIHRGVYVVGHRSVSRTSRLRAAVLACGEGAVVSHGTAAAFWGLWDRWPSLIDVTVPCEAGRKIGGVHSRRCRYPEPDEVVERAGVACTTVARTLIDLAGMADIPTLRRTVERAAVVKLLDLSALDRSMHWGKGRRGLRALNLIIAGWRTPNDATPDVRSDFEALVLPILVAAGLPRPLANEKLRIGGERLMVDFLWKDHGVVVETDGAATHLTPFAFQVDRRRDQILLAAGYRVLRVTWNQIQHEGDDVVARIVRTLVLAERR
jgi:hypothetical protein